MLGLIDQLIGSQAQNAGHVNAVLKVWSAEKGEKTALILKIFSKDFVIREDRDSMCTIMRVAAAGGVGAHVHAEFNNGLVYDYTHGDVCNPDVFPHDERMRRYNNNTINNNNNNINNNINKHNMNT